MAAHSWSAFCFSQYLSQYAAHYPYSVSVTIGSSSWEFFTANAVAVSCCDQILLAMFHLLDFLNNLSMFLSTPFFLSLLILTRYFWFVTCNSFLSLSLLNSPGSSFYVLLTSWSISLLYCLWSLSVLHVHLFTPSCSSFYCFDHYFFFSWWFHIASESTLWVCSI